MPARQHACRHAHASPPARLRRSAAPRPVSSTLALQPVQLVERLLHLRHRTSHLPAIRPHRRYLPPPPSVPGVNRGGGSVNPRPPQKCTWGTGAGAALSSSLCSWCEWGLVGRRTSSLAVSSSILCSPALTSGSTAAAAETRSATDETGADETGAEGPVPAPPPPSTSPPSPPSPDPMITTAPRLPISVPAPPGTAPSVGGSALSRAGEPAPPPPVVCPPALTSGLVSSAAGRARPTLTGSKSGGAPAPGGERRPPNAFPGVDASGWAAVGIIPAGMDVVCLLAARLKAFTLVAPVPSAVSPTSPPTPISSTTASAGSTSRCTGGSSAATRGGAAGSNPAVRNGHSLRTATDWISSTGTGP
eukprot:scaffold10191_cov108-Isochrysis_galbana.AAC.4